MKKHCNLEHFLSKKLNLENVGGIEMIVMIAFTNVREKNLQCLKVNKHQTYLNF